MNSLRNRLYLVYAWAVLTAVMLLTPMPESANPDTVTFFDKIVHGVLFGVFAFLIYYAMLIIGKDEFVINPEKGAEAKKSKNIKLPIRKVLAMYLMSVFISISYSISLEYLQVYVPGRSPNDYDLISSVVGVALVLLFVYGGNYIEE